MESNNVEHISLYRQQELAHHFPHFDRNDAWELGCLMRKRAETLGYNFAMGIQIGDLQVFSYVFPERKQSQADWVRRKCNTVLYSKCSSIRFTAEMNQAGKTLADFDLDPAIYGDSGGGFPIHVEGEGVIGAVAVSGLPAEVDHQFVVNSITEFLRTNQA